MTVPNWLSRAGKWLTLIGLVFIVAACDSSSSSKNKNEDKDPVDESTTFETELGAIEGWDRETYNAFLGIPYAKPPVGELRFAPPEAADSIWDSEEPWSATEYGNICPQMAPDVGLAGNEDCLYLNVFTPADLEGGPYPVMVWIHGGAFIFGDGGATYTPTRLVQEDVVVVTINYRLGILGLLAHEALSLEQEGSSGAYSLMDQQLALQWVQDNIEAFNGNPDNVTIFGESAGGFSVLAHLASPKSAGLFHRAIVQSGSYEGTQRSQTAAMAVGATLANDFGCGVEHASTMLECLRNADVTAILGVQANLPTMTPAEHHEVLPKSINTAFATKDFNEVPVLSGTNSDEWSYFLAFGGTEIDESNYVETLGGVFALGGLDPATLVPAVLAEYDLEEDFDGDAASLVTAVGTDAVFACPAMAQHSLLAPEVNTYVYWFVDRDAPPPLPEPEWLKLGATHAAEIQYIFGDDAIFAARGASDDQVALANTMTRMWADFARHGNPNPEDGTLTWSTYTNNPLTESIMSLDAGEVKLISALAFNAAHRCRFWASLGSE